MIEEDTFEVNHINGMNNMQHWLDTAESNMLLCSLKRGTRIPICNYNLCLKNAVKYCPQEILMLLISNWVPFNFTMTAQWLQKASEN